jgi:hypothetical protein
MPYTPLWARSPSTTIFVLMKNPMNTIKNAACLSSRLKG